MADETTQVTGTTALGLAIPAEPTLAQTTSQQEAAPETPVQPAYVTREELEQTMAETLRRVKQSDKDRMKQIDTKLDAITTRLQSSGAQLTPQQVNVLREQITEEVEGTSAQDTRSPASNLTPEMQRQADYVSDQLDLVFADVGATVDRNDPEWKEVKAVLDDPKGNLAKLIRIAGKQAEAKIARLAAQKENAAARAISAGGAQSTTTPTLTPEQKISQGLWGNNR